MKRKAVLVTATLALMLGAGCRASLEGKKVGAVPQADPNAGLTYFLTKPVFTIDVKDKHGDKKAEPVYDLKVSSAADPERRFSVRMSAGTISKDVATFKLRPDGTLMSFGANPRVRSRSSSPRWETWPLRRSRSRRSAACSRGSLKRVPRPSIRRSTMPSATARSDPRATPMRSALPRKSHLSCCKNPRRPAVATPTWSALRGKQCQCPLRG